MRIVLLLAVVGCATEPPPAPVVEEAPQMPVIMPITAGSPVQPSIPAGTEMPKVAEKSLPNGGKVVETMNSGGYTYAKLQACGTTTWVAGPMAGVKVGDEVATAGNMPMRDFKSKTLDRTFSSIRFVTSIRPSPTPVDCSGAPSPHGGSGSPHGARSKPANPHDEGMPMKSPVAAGGSRQGKVLETMKSGGYSYARVDFCGTETWVAGPAIELAVGSSVSVGTGMPMTNFHSKTLDRTFSSIDFVSSMKAMTGAPECG